jgi:hypothetical protein
MDESRLVGSYEALGGNPDHELWTSSQNTVRTIIWTKQSIVCLLNIAVSESRRSTRLAHCKTKRVILIFDDTWSRAIIVYLLISMCLSLVEQRMLAGERREGPRTLPRALNSHLADRSGVSVRRRNDVRCPVLQ